MTEQQVISLISPIGPNSLIRLIGNKLFVETEWKSYLITRII